MIPRHEEDQETLLLTDAALKHFSKRTPPNETEKLVQLAVRASDTLTAFRAKDDVKAMSYSSGEWTGFPLIQYNLSQSLKHVQIKRGEKEMPLPKKMKFSANIERSVQVPSPVMAA